MAVRSQAELRGYFETLPSGSRSINPVAQVNLDAPVRVDQLLIDSVEGVTSVIVGPVTPPANTRGYLVVIKEADDLTSLSIGSIDGEAEVGFYGIRITIEIGEWIFIRTPLFANPPDIYFNAVGDVEAHAVLEITWF